ncbi:PREDICTED: SPARC-related modular calcium-binding protein 2 [Dipodomys ordii]|uniref:SPARC-related modular calcium-binding protein 2 n=1 Tax=Dipodomys ordii TaxID=10020 RepID=A0A1S3FUB1_DIPOR|nr:PREDICTED: SPARC-related modular calcium-binding protein 2 [Dipodomys ordii]
MRITPSAPRGPPPVHPEDHPSAPRGSPPVHPEDNPQCTPRTIPSVPRGPPPVYPEDHPQCTLRTIPSVPRGPPPVHPEDHPQCTMRITHSVSRGPPPVHLHPEDHPSAPRGPPPVHPEDHPQCTPRIAPSAPRGPPQCILRTTPSAPRGPPAPKGHCPSRSSHVHIPWVPSLVEHENALVQGDLGGLFLRVDQDKGRDCSADCTGSPQRPLCASDGRTFLSRCEFQRAKCKDPQLEIAYRGNCKVLTSERPWERRGGVHRDLPVTPAFSAWAECRGLRQLLSTEAPVWVWMDGYPCDHQAVTGPLAEQGADGLRGFLEHGAWASRPGEAPNAGAPAILGWEIGLAASRPRSQVQCHSYTGYCWCVTPNGRPISGTAVAHKTPRCPGSVNEKLPQREGTGKADDAAAPALETQPQGDEEDIASRYPTLWTEQVKSRQNKTNKNSASSCDQEQQSALEEAKHPKNDNVVIPECAHGGLYKPVQCHPSTGYCWCVLVDTGRPIPGTSTRYEQPKCDSTARAHPAKARDAYRGRQLQGCPGAKKHEFLTSILDALSTDMVHAVSDPSTSSGRLSEPDPSHTLEERVVHWYFKLLDKNSSGDIGKKEIKPFKRFLRKKSKPKKCVKKFVEYCDVNNDKAISVQELMGCLGASKEEAHRAPLQSPGLVPATSPAPQLSSMSACSSLPHGCPGLLWPSPWAPWKGRPPRTDHEQAPAEGTAGYVEGADRPQV